MFQRTTAIQKILKLNRFVRGIQGGTSAGKTYGILPIIIDKCIKIPRLDCSVVSESIPHLKRGAIKDFKNIMYDTGRWVDSNWNATDFKYTFSNNATMDFFSAADHSKLRGGRRDWAYINEANNISFQAYTEIASRTKEGIFLDWNPTAPFWFHEELLGGPRVDFLTINYTDNESCPAAAKSFILEAKEKAETSAFWRNWYNVYGLGQIGTLQGAIFENWAICKEVPADAELIAYGLDFGFTNDPTALIAVYRYDGELYVDQLIYETRLTNSDIITRLQRMGLARHDVIIADSAEPKSIEDLTRAGYSVEAAQKGGDSIINSIDTLQQFKINVTERSVDVIKELRHYKWLSDRDGKRLNAPIDAYNHAIDALRYVALNRINKGYGNLCLDF